MKIPTVSGTPKQTIAEQIVANARLRSAPSDHFPEEARRPVIYNEDALLVHPSQVFLNPRNSRKSFNEAKIDELAASMKMGDVGVLEPLIVRVRGASSDKVRQYEVTAGDRRLLAAQRAELALIPIIVKRIDDRMARRINLIENLQREDLVANQMGEALQELKNDMQSELDEFLESNAMTSETPISLLVERWNAIKARRAASAPGWLFPTIERAMGMQPPRNPKVTWADVSGEVGLKDRSIYYYTAIADLPDDIQEAVTDGELSAQQSRAITQLDDPKQQRQLFEEIKKDGLSGEKATARAREISGKTPLAVPRATSTPSTKPPKVGASSLSEHSSAREYVLILKALRDDARMVQSALEKRAAKLGAPDAQMRQELRAPLKEMQEAVAAIAASVAPPQMDSSSE